MPTPFDALDAAMSASMTAAFGEAATLRPRVASQYAERADDPGRPAATITGVFSAGPAEVPIKGNSKGGEFSGPTKFTTVRSEFWIDAARVAQLPYRPAVGDLVILPGRGGAAYEIVGMQPTDMGDLNLILAFDEVPT